jgi:hypothetical protein
MCTVQSSAPRLAFIGSMRDNGPVPTILKSRTDGKIAERAARYDSMGRESCQWIVSIARGC